MTPAVIHSRKTSTPLRLDFRVRCVKRQACKVTAKIRNQEGYPSYVNAAFIFALSIGVIAAVTTAPILNR